MIQHRTRTLQLIFVARFKELSKHLTSHNPFYQLCNRLKNSTSPPKDPVHKVIELKRDGEYHTISTKHPILHLPAFSRDRHRLVKWHMHWLLSYPLKNAAVISSITGFHVLKLAHHSDGWKKAWPALVNVLREINRLSHFDDDFNEDEPNPEDNIVSSPLSPPHTQ
ncbi:hypothetical protein BDC45DRAFT_534029 [Circinella umbellata]|nr:hypothetical protein BDC45DRAFT_534029 [Circinella umbellata]